LACPGLAHATHGFIVPTESPQFFSSYAVTIVLIETLLAMIVATSEADVTAAIQRVEANNQVLGEYLVE
jgi:DNA-binding MurR/RpiR family transcriptional regulator